MLRSGAEMVTLAAKSGCDFGHGITIGPEEMKIILLGA
jgi:hypothetical protein